jgi:PAS domain S-box-containing protein
MSTRVVGWLARALHATRDGAFATTDGKVVLWNAAAERLLGYTAHDVLGQPWSDVIRVPERDAARVGDRDSHILAGLERHEPFHTSEMRARTKAGRPLWVAMTVLAVPATTIHVMRDVTATRELLTLVRERLASHASSTNGAVHAEASLTPREIEILGLLAHGLNTVRVAERLRVSRATVRNHVQNILDKLGVHSRLEAVAYATRPRLV